MLTLRNGEVWRADALLAQHQERYFKDVIVDGARLNMALKQLEVDYVPLVFPGFSWGNLKNSPDAYNQIPRQ